MMPALVRTTRLLAVRRAGAPAKLTGTLRRVRRWVEWRTQVRIIDAAGPDGPRRPLGNGASEALVRACSEPAAASHSRLASLTESPSGPQIPRGRAEGVNEIKQDRMTPDEFRRRSICNFAWLSHVWGPL